MPKRKPEKGRIFEHSSGFPKTGDYVEFEDGELYRIRVLAAQTCECDDEERHLHAEFEWHDFENDFDPEGELFEDCTITLDDEDAPLPHRANEA